MMSVNIQVGRSQTKDFNKNNTTTNSIQPSIVIGESLQIEATEQHVPQLLTTATGQQQMMNKQYKKDQFLQIIQQLSQQDPLYYCQQQNLQMIYQKTIQHQGQFSGVQLMQFAQALKQRNKDKFKEQIKFYKQYIGLSKQKGQLSISSRQLLNSLYLNQQVGYLTSAVYEMVKKEEEVEIEKLENMIDRVWKEFVQEQRVCVPKRVQLKRSAIYMGDEQEYKQQITFEVSPDRSSYFGITSSKAAQQILTLQFIHQLKQQVIDNIQYCNQQTYNNIQSQFNKLQQCVKVVNQRIIPALKQEVQSLRQSNIKMEQELCMMYSEMESKQGEVIAGKNALLELTEQNRVVNKELLNCKLIINEKDEIIYQLEEELIKAQNDKAILHNKTESFFNQYTNLKQDYQKFVEQVKLEEERKTQAQQSNILPTISLKQQLQDAQFKIKKLKSDKEQLLKDMENNQNIFVVKLVNLEKELEQAKLYSNNNVRESLKFTGMSRLSRNYQLFMNMNRSKQQSMVRKSIYSSIVGSVLTQSRLPPQYNQQQQQYLLTPNIKVNKMSSYIQQVDDLKMMEKSKRKQLSNYNDNRFSYVENVNVDDVDDNDDEDNTDMVVPISPDKNRKTMFTKKHNKETTVINQSCQESHYQQQNKQQQQKQSQQLQVFTDKFEEQFYRQSKGQPKFNFTQVDFQNLKKKWKTQDPDVLHDGQIDEVEKQNEVKNVINNHGDTNISKTPSQTIFITPTDIISKAGIRYKKHLVFNRKGVFMFDTKLRLQKTFNYKKIMKITFTYYNLDTFVMSFRRDYNMLRKKSPSHEGDLVFKCFRTKQLLQFLSQPIFRQSILRNVKITIQKQSNIWIHDSNEKDSVLTHCGNYYNPFKLGLSLKNQSNRLFFAELSRENYFSFSYLITCVIEEFGVYCFEWCEDQLEKERKFIYLLPLVKRMVFIREVEGDVVKIVYEDWSDGKTFLLTFKSSKEALRFETMCKHQLKLNLAVLENRKNRIQKLFKSTDENQNNKNSNNKSPKKKKKLI